MSKYVNDIHELVNDAISESIGENATLLLEDLSNVVDVGSSVLNSDHKDLFVKSLIRRIGKTVVVGKTYGGKDLGLLTDGFTYGSVLQKIHIAAPEFEEDESWKLEKGHTYETQLFYGAGDVKETFYEQKSALKISISIATKQVESAFVSAESLDSFISGIFLAISNKIALLNEQLALRCVNMALAENCYNVDYTGKGTETCVNVLQIYNDEFGLTGTDDAVTEDNCLTDAGFIRFVIYYSGILKDRMSHQTRLYNKEGWLNWTPEGTEKVIMYAPLKEAADTYLFSQNRHNEYLSLGDVKEISAWQGVTNADNFDTAVSGTFKAKDSAGHEVTGPGLVLACIFSPEALMIYNRHDGAESKYNEVGRFTNYWNFYETSMLYDKNENFVCLIANDPS